MSEITRRDFMKAAAGTARAAAASGCTGESARIDEGEYAVALSRAADQPVERGKVRLTARFVSN